MMGAEHLAVEFLRSLFHTLDREDFIAAAELLTEDSELADELTGAWIRGRAGVSAYLLKQTGVVTDVRSQLSSLVTSRLADDVALVTFAVRQDYRLSAENRGEDLLGTAILDLAIPNSPKLL